MKTDTPVLLDLPLRERPSDERSQKLSVLPLPALHGLRDVPDALDAIARWADAIGPLASCEAQPDLAKVIGFELRQTIAALAETLRTREEPTLVFAPDPGWIVPLEEAALHVLCDGDEADCVAREAAQLALGAAIALREVPPRAARHERTLSAE